MIRLNQHAVFDLQDIHLGVAGEQTDQQAFMVWVKMLNQNEGHAVIFRQDIHELPTCFKTTSRSAYSDNKKI